MRNANFINLLNQLVNSSIKDLRQISYCLATVRWECSNTFEPIEEKGNKKYFDKYEPETKIGKTLGNIQKGDGYKYRGRGFVMITGRNNYKRVGELLNVYLLNNPELACDPEIAFKILEIGMRDGLFTGKKLSDYFTDITADWYNARKIINGLDKAELIASYGRQYYSYILSVLSV